LFHYQNVNISLSLGKNRYEAANVTGPNGICVQGSNRVANQKYKNTLGRSTRIRSAAHGSFHIGM
jgi:hypothetical protein